MNTNPLFFSTQRRKDYTQQQVKTGNAIEFGVTEGFAGRGIDLNEQLIPNKPTTFFMRVNSDVMIGAGIHNGDMVIVDQSILAGNGKVIIAVLNGEMLIRRLSIANNKKRLLPETNKLAPIDIDQGSEFTIWGVVTYVIHQM